MTEFHFWVNYPFKALLTQEQPNDAGVGREY